MIEQLIFTLLRLWVKYIASPLGILGAMIRMRYLEVIHHGDVPIEKFLPKGMMGDEVTAFTNALAALDCVCERLKINKEKSIGRAYMFGFFHNQIPELKEAQRVVQFMNEPHHCKAALEFLIHHKDIKREMIPFVAEGGQAGFDAWLEKDDILDEGTRLLAAKIMKNREEKGLPL